MATPGKCSEWTRRRCKHRPRLYGAANVCAVNVCAECVEEQSFEPNAFYYTSKLRDNYECDDEEDT